jgi:hypothetical protein
MARGDDDQVIHSGHHFESIMFPRAAEEKRQGDDAPARTSGARRAMAGLQRANVGPAIRRAAKR